jgi:glycosyltransferase involved in cell wall biosynthesis
MRVLVLTKYGNKGASSRYRVYQFINNLNQFDIHFDIQPLISDELLSGKYKNGKYNLLGIMGSIFRRIITLINKGKYDLLWIQKELLPWLPKQLEILLLKGKVPYIIDFDDAEFLKYNNQTSLIMKYLFNRKIETLVRGTSGVIVGNGFLKNSFEIYNENIYVIPTVIDLSKYPKAPSLNQSKSKLVIGWIGSPSTQKYLNLIKDVLGDLVEKFDVKIHLIGANDTGFDHESFEEIRWSEDTYLDSLSKIDIGIMPLLDTEWERGKCGFKLLQYMGMHKPVIASPIGVNNDIVDSGVNGFLAGTIDEWKIALEVLIKNPNLREEMGLKGREKVEANYSIDGASKQILNVLDRFRN